MNSLIIAAILAVLIIALLIVFLMMKRGKSESRKHINNKAPNFDNRTNFPANPVTQAKQASTEATPSVSSPRSSVMIAQSFIEQQRYDEAEAELKTAMRLQPDDYSIPLKLLNLYAITNNSESFHDIFAIILDKGDTSSIQEAKQIKSMLDAEKATEQLTQDSAISSSENTAQQESGLDFDAFLNEDASDNNSLETEKNLTDDLDSNVASTGITGLSLDSDLQTDNSSSLNSANSDSLPELTSEIEPSLELATADIEAELNNSDLNELSLSESSPSIDELDAFSLDSTLDSNNSNVDSDNHLNDNLNLSSEPNIELSSELNELTLETDAQPEAPVASSLTDTAQTTDDTTNELSLDAFEDFSLEIDETSLTTEAETTADNITAELTAELDPAIDKNISPSITGITAATAVVAGSTLLDEPTEVANSNEEPSLELEEFSLESHVTEPVIDELSIVDETIANKPVTESVDAPSELSPTHDEPVELETAGEDSLTTAAPVDLSAEFEFISDIDKNQVTLDLASQYLDLGEYDSAKRLIHEVIANGNDAQKEQAKSLLSHAG